MDDKSASFVVPLLTAKNRAERERKSPFAATMAEEEEEEEEEEASDDTLIAEEEEEEEEVRD